MKTYSEKLKDPRWQRKRLEVMADAGWRCEICSDSKEELHVHHKQYRDGAEPWQYDRFEMECLCSTCHQLSHFKEDKINKFRKRRQIGTVQVVFIGRMLARMPMKCQPEGLWPEIIKLRQKVTEEYSELRKSADARWVAITRKHQSPT